MLRIMMAALIVALTILSSCTGSQTPNSNRPPDSEKAVSGITTVTVSFSGLMVLHKEKEGDGYEVGVVARDFSGGHLFSVIHNGQPVPLPSPNNFGQNWTLSITHWTPPVGAEPPANVGHPPGETPKRHPDHIEGQNDFSWIVDLEGTEFHGRELPLRTGRLKPIIHLPNLRLYTLYKSIDLDRQQGTLPLAHFGFVAETIAMQAQLQQGQELVLTDNDKNVVVARVPYSSHQIPQRLQIENVKHPAPDVSDFRLYYTLFENVSDDEQFDFAKGYTEPTLPLNPLPHRSFLAHERMAEKNRIPPTCCGMDCSVVLLGKRKEPLW